MIKGILGPYLMTKGILELPSHDKGDIGTLSYDKRYTGAPFLMIKGILGPYLMTKGILELPSHDKGDIGTLSYDKRYTGAPFS